MWAEKAIHEPFRGATVGVEDFSTLSTKAAVLGAMGRTPEADAVMDKALALPGAGLFDMHAYGVGLMHASRPERALKIFAANQQRHPEEGFWTYFDLARAYTTLGDKPNAIKNWEIPSPTFRRIANSCFPNSRPPLKSLRKAARKSSEP